MNREERRKQKKEKEKNIRILDVYTWKEYIDTNNAEDFLRYYENQFKNNNVDFNRDMLEQFLNHLRNTGGEDIMPKHFMEQILSLKDKKDS